MSRAASLLCLGSVQCGVELQNDFIWAEKLCLQLPALSIGSMQSADSVGGLMIQSGQVHSVTTLLVLYIVYVISCNKVITNSCTCIVKNIFIYPYHTYLEDFPSIDAS